MCVRLGTGVWCNPVTKMMISPEPVDHEKHVSLCLLSSFCFSRSHRGWHKSTNCTCKWMHATHANRCHLFNSLQKVFSNLELRAALSSEAFPCMEVCIFLFHPSFDLLKCCRLEFSFLWRAATQFTVHVLSQPTSISSLPVIYALWAPVSIFTTERATRLSSLALVGR